MRLRARTSLGPVAVPALSTGILIVAVLTSCADISGPTRDTTVVGAAGGVFAFLDSAVLIVFPPNAVATDMEFSVTWDRDVPDAAQLVTGTTFAVTPTYVLPQDIDIRVRTSAFNLPVGPSGVQLGKNVTGPWDLLTTRVVNQSAGVIAATTSTFGSFGLLVPVSAIHLAPLADTIIVGDTVRFAAIPLAGDSTVLTDRPVVWSSSAEPVATVSGLGLVTGVAAGTAVVVATSEGRSDSATVTVTRPGP